jgi:hypothetical protein
VSTVALDELISAGEIPAPDCIKIDVEGWGCVSKVPGTWSRPECRDRLDAGHPQADVAGYNLWSQRRRLATERSAPFGPRLAVTAT